MTLVIGLCLALGSLAGCGRVDPPFRFTTRMGREADIRRTLLLQPRLRPQPTATPDIVPEQPSDEASQIAGAITHGPRHSDMVALTLDDGPSRQSETVLGILAQEHAVVTFFYVGDRVPFNPWAARRAVSLGCDVEDHTLTHVELVGMSANEVAAQLLDTRETIYDVTGRLPMWARPRAGRIDPLAADVVRELGMGLVLWDTEAADTIAPGRSAEGIAHNVIARARPGSIVLLHETNPLTVQALPEMIEGLRARGFELVTLTRMLRSPSHALAIQ